MGALIYVPVHHVCAVSLQKSKGCQAFWYRNYRWLWATMQKSETEPESSATFLNFGAISTTPMINYFLRQGLL